MDPFPPLGYQFPSGKGKGNPLRLKKPAANSAFAPSPLRGQPRLWLLILAGLIGGSSPMSGQGRVSGSKHDLSFIYQRQTMMHGTAISNYAQVCVYCHTPHHANAQANAPLWNRSLPDAGTYIPYSSVSMVGISEAPRGASLACLSCHDGSVAADTVLNMPGHGIYPLVPVIGISAAHAKMNAYKGPGNCGYCHSGAGHPRASNRIANYLGTDLSKHHPVSILYPSNTAAFNPASTLASAGIPLVEGRVECTSCHAVHDPTHIPFLRTNNAASFICRTCHAK